MRLALNSKPHKKAFKNLEQSNQTLLNQLQMKLSVKERLKEKLVIKKIHNEKLFEGR